ncbi:MAG: glycosyltransferase family 2 protein [Bacteroidales bacterium]
MSNPLVIVLILSYNGKQLLEDSISSYLANDYPNFKVVVIDNGSIDGTKEWVEQTFPGIFVLRTEKNLGYSGGFNFGLDYAFNQLEADYVLITNNDVKADSNVISELVKVAGKDPLIGFVTGKVYYFDKPDVIQSIGYFEDPVRWIGGHIGQGERDIGQYNLDEQRFMTDDIFILVRNDLYLKIGGYNPVFKFQCEQADWQIRGKKNNFKIYYAHKAKIWHKESMTIGKSSPFKVYYDVRNTLILRLVHKGEEYNRRYFKWYFKNIVIIPFVKNTLKLRLPYSWAIFRGFCSAMTYAGFNNLFKIKYLF